MCLVQAPINCISLLVCYINCRVHPFIYEHNVFSSASITGYVYECLNCVRNIVQLILVVHRVQ